MNDAPGGTVQLFVTCLIDGLSPRVGQATVALLEHLGLGVEFPFDQTCCGQPPFNAGFREQARRIGIHTLRVLDATEGPIVVPSGSCSDMLIHHLPDLVDDDDDLAAAAARVAGRVRELTQFVVDDLGVTDVGAAHGARVTYHRSCHGLRGLGLAGQAEALLDQVAGLQRCELNGAEECCGFGGLFSVELPEVSAAIMDTKLDNVLASGADTLVGGDVGCLMHLEGGLRRRGVDLQVRHVAEILADGLESGASR